MLWLRCYQILALLVVSCLTKESGVLHWYHRYPNKVQRDHNDDFKANIPLLALWSPSLHLQLGRMRIECPKSVTCYTTGERSVTTDRRLQAILMNGPDVRLDNLPLPRAKRVLWGLLFDDVPLKNPLFLHPAMLSLFNFTATYHSSSDFPLTSLPLRDLAQLTARSPMSTREKTRYVLQGLAPVFYLQSLCSTMTNRDDFVRALQRHIPIDSYGRCLNNRAIPTALKEGQDHADSVQMVSFSSKYKFHLIIEAYPCPQAITPDLFRALDAGAVPVYRGVEPRLVRHLIPATNAVIFVDDFPSVEALANHLHRLDQHHDEYDDLLRYKRPGGFQNANLMQYLTKERHWHGRLRGGRGEAIPPNKDRNVGRMSHLQAFLCYACVRASMHQGSHKRREVPRFANLTHLECPVERYLQRHANQTADNKSRQRSKSTLREFLRVRDLTSALHALISARRPISQLNRLWNDQVTRREKPKRQRVPIYIKRTDL